MEIHAIGSMRNPANSNRALTIMKGGQLSTAMRKPRKLAPVVTHSTTRAPPTAQWGGLAEVRISAGVGGSGKRCLGGDRRVIRLRSGDIVAHPFLPPFGDFVAAEYEPFERWREQQSRVGQRRCAGFVQAAFLIAAVFCTQRAQTAGELTRSARSDDVLSFHSHQVS